ncbi:MAG: hypothetical protein AABX03_03490 [Nanoarchaeota archaeon]
MNTSTQNSSDKKLKSIDKLLEFQSKLERVIFNFSSNSITHYHSDNSTQPEEIEVSENFEDYVRDYMVNKLKVNRILIGLALEDISAGSYGSFSESKDLKINYIIEANRNFVRRN